VSRLGLQFDVVRELDGEEVGGIMGFDLRGHYGPDDVDLFLAYEAAEYFDDEYAPVGGWDVATAWRHTTPIPITGGWRYSYRNRPGAGWTPVTQLLKAWETRHWCINHPLEAGDQGIPASMLVDGEQMVTENLPDPDAIDPHPVVEAPTKYTTTGYVYMCRECSKAFNERYRAAQAEALAALDTTTTTDDTTEDPS